jgi:hypothetical protein
MQYGYGYGYVHGLFYFLCLKMVLGAFRIRLKEKWEGNLLGSWAGSQKELLWFWMTVVSFFLLVTCKCANFHHVQAGEKLNSLRRIDRRRSTVMLIEFYEAQCAKNAKKSKRSSLPILEPRCTTHYDSTMCQSRTCCEFATIEASAPSATVECETLAVVCEFVGEVPWKRGIPWF